jgi:ABC-type transport system involved in multi-copper enzyme maturation permease subunit
MKALFVKELRRGRLLPLFGLSLAVLVAILCGGMFVAYPPLVSESAMSDWALFGILILASVVIALIAGAGLFASEAERGTLLLLLALPVSRPRIWLAKVAAGLALGVSATALLVPRMILVVPGAVGNPFSASSISGAFAFASWWVVLFSAAVLFSTLLEHMVSAFLAAILLSFGTLVLVSAMVRLWGGSLLGSNPWNDASLWALAMTTGLLLGSLTAFSRGEILRSGRKWLFGICVSVLSAGAVVLLVVGGFRWAMRYERVRVERVDRLGLFSNGGIASAEAMRCSFKWEKTPEGWRPLRAMDRTKHLVLVDLKTGRELFVRRGRGVAAVSDDGRLVALVTQPFTLTWRPDGYWYTSRVETRDLKTGSLLYRGWPREFPKDRNISPSRDSVESAEWSPDGSWLALQERRWGDWVQLMRPDGGGARAIPLWPYCDLELGGPSRPWDWDPSAAAVYLLVPDTRESARPTPGLGRCRLPEGQPTPIWNPQSAARLPADYDWVTAHISVSPDGDWIAVGLVAAPYKCGPNPEGPRTPGLYVPGLYKNALVFVFLVAADAKQSFLLSRRSFQNGFKSLDYAWSKDGKCLYYLVRSEALGSDLRVWRHQQERGRPLLLPPGCFAQGIAILPKSGRLLIWASHDVLLADERDQVQPFPNARVRSLAQQYSLLGLDREDRAIVQESGLPWKSNMLGAVDLATGALRQIYP